MSDDLFGRAGDALMRGQAPLAARLRPTRLADLVGQPHLTEAGGILRTMAEGRIRSSIFYGPPGTGKTTAARLLADSRQSAFVPLSAVETGTQDLRRTAEQARQRWGMESRGTVVFVDEIHRFSRTQQDVLLPYVEEGVFVLLGATTENPWVSLTSALLSRCLLVEFRPLGPAEVAEILERAWQSRAAWWKPATCEPGVLQELARRAGGDSRLALTLLERLALAADSLGSSHLDVALLNRIWGDSAHYHDKRGDRHYDLISAMIKSIRGSDPDAALYWMGRLLAGGEDPRFIMRRVLVHAAEDIGLADPQALLVAHAAWTALEAVGLPEARIPMAEAVVYLATAPKSHSVIEALGRMDAAVRQWPDAPVPEALRDRHLAGRPAAPYRYPHDFPDHFVADSHLPAGMEGLLLYEPSNQGAEAEVGRRLARWRQLRDEAARPAGDDSAQ